MHHEKVGTLLCYTCGTCGGQNWTVIADEGIAMQRIACRRTDTCKGVALFNPTLTDRVTWSDIRPHPTHEWYKMSRAEARRLDKKYEGIFEYYRSGGLGLRRIRK